MIKVESPNHALHKEVLAKVNAYVDEEIAPLVEVLNTFDKVQTFESCQGRDGTVDGLAFVQMTYGNSKGADFARVATIGQTSAYRLYCTYEYPATEPAVTIMPQSSTTSRPSRG